MLLTAGAATAAGASTIEGVWSFNGGEIAIQPEGGGKYEGIVVAPTTFASCVHPIGQEIWKGITLQTDGSYWGLHQWYKTENCQENPVLGPTAYRVVDQTDGSRYLRVCLSSPGTGQPSIPPGSSGIGASYGCGNSALTAPLARSKVGSFKEVVSLPSAKKCFSARKFAIHIRNAKYDPFKAVSVRLAGKRLHAALHGSVYVATINLKGLPHGAFTVKITAITFRGNRVSGKRTYHTCVPGHKKRASKKAK
ncbi:MAG TPA: hypothetical protein VH061_05510 [Solirubrobacteraceae bacterium]|jgi:hypothetical protein|nr:hypothetical protein [Solirubrobacteraceae bacterium]